MNELIEVLYKKKQVIQGLMELKKTKHLDGLIEIIKDIKCSIENEILKLVSKNELDNLTNKYEGVRICNRIINVLNQIKVGNIKNVDNLIKKMEEKMREVNHE